jgi:hypothetical protein
MPVIALAGGGAAAALTIGMRIEILAKITAKIGAAGGCSVSLPVLPHPPSK